MPTCPCRDIKKKLKKEKNIKNYPTNIKNDIKEEEEEDWSDDEIDTSDQKLFCILC